MKNLTFGTGNNTEPKILLIHNKSNGAPPMLTTEAFPGKWIKNKFCVAVLFLKLNQVNHVFFCRAGKFSFPAPYITKLIRCVQLDIGQQGLISFKLRKEMWVKQIADADNMLSNQSEFKRISTPMPSHRRIWQRSN